MELIPGKELRVRPAGTTRAPVPPEVSQSYRDLYNEAAGVLHISARASAALSRRCLQQLVRVEFGVTKPNLYDEIEEVIKERKVPGYLAGQLHYVREIGNMAAHPMKNPQTDAILDVEPGEAEANLDLLDGLFDFVFVEPARAVARRSALDAKLGRSQTQDETSSPRNPTITNG